MRPSPSEPPARALLGLPSLRQSHRCPVDVQKKRASFLWLVEFKGEPFPQKKKKGQNRGAPLGNWWVRAVLKSVGNPCKEPQVLSRLSGGRGSQPGSGG